MAVMRLGSGLTLLLGSRSEIFLYSAAPTRASCFGPCLTGASAFSSYDFTGVEDVVEVPADRRICSILSWRGLGAHVNLLLWSHHRHRGECLYVLANFVMPLVGHQYILRTGEETKGLLVVLQLSTETFLYLVHSPSL